MSKEQCKNFILKATTAVFVALLVFVAFRYAIPALFPFIIAFALAALIKPLTRLLCNKLHLNNRIVGSLLTATLYILILALLVLICALGYNFIQSLASRFKDDIVPAISNIFNDVIARLGEWSPQAVPFLNQIQDSLITLVGDRISSFSINSLGSIVSSLPQFLIGVLFMIITTFYLATDNGRLGRIIESRMSAERYDKLIQYKRNLGKTVFKFIKSYSIIFVITFAELCLGLFICGVPRFWLIALLIALFDILPVVGSGTILAPWGLINLLRGDIAQGVGLFVLWIAMSVIRQIIEPHIVGKQVGLHPLLTLMSMYVGLILFGAIGLIGLPLCLALFVSLEESGVITLFKKRDLLPIEKPEKKRKSPFKKRRK
ncbi:MAG: sporulation integral membrane protein YtvI [Clostridia bacterium]|nr:sporulation integral membrane protein YtvI [Clostridia bacterium]